jgi:hypothetical protein
MKFDFPTISSEDPYYGISIARILKKLSIALPNYCNLKLTMFNQKIQHDVAPTCISTAVK